MIVKGMSLTNHYRRQFDSILVKSSYEKLFQKLKKKIAKQQQQQIKKLALNTYTHYQDAR
jgi:vacuolar-type H+-ATPase catalytic subunit A/Vma1